MQTTPTVATTSTRAVIDAARRLGVDGDALLARHGLERSVLEDHEARLPAPLVGEIWREAAVLAGEPELPVRAALELPWGAYRAIDLLAGSAPTAGEAFLLLSRYFRLVHDTVRLPVEAADDGGATLRITRRDGGQIPAPYVDYTLTACIDRVSRVAGVRLHGQVWLRRSAPADPGHHRRGLGPHLVFGADEDRVDFPPIVWRTPLPTRDPVLQSVLSEHVDLLVQSLPPPPDGLDDVRTTLIDALPKGRAELAYVASRLGVSARTLQRRLSEVDLTWGELLANTRRTLAERLLGDPSLGVDEIAVLLGYAEASTFHRAFRKWVGTTPGAWRQSTFRPVSGRKVADVTAGPATAG